jgi:KaiC/GvpD/RAD55 family RecA-like ATPase
MQVRIVQVPPSFPPKWDLADLPPPGVDLHALLASARAKQPRLMAHITTAAQFVLRDIPPREQIVDPFLPTSSLSMIYAARGVGKTWFALALCVAISHGDDFLTFDVPRARTVLFIDGEMALADLQSRVRSLDASPSENLLLLPSESLFREDKPLNINAPEDQDAIEKAIEALQAEGRGPEVVVFDNLSSLSGGIDENDNSALDALLQWLIRLRHRGLAIVLVHHAGKSGDQRGASRREDLLDTSIKLEKPKKQKDDEDDDPLLDNDGAAFKAEFVKTRGKMPNPSVIGMALVDGPSGTLVWETEHGEGATAKDKTLKAIALKNPASQKELMAILGCSKGSVSQHCTALRNAGLLDGMSLTRAGREHLIGFWPELAQRLAVQDDLPI